MRLTFRHYAGEHERYAPRAWDSAVGAPVKVEGAPTGRVVAVEVVEDGRAVDLTIEADASWFDPGQLSLGNDDQDGRR